MKIKCSVKTNEDCHCSRSVHMSLDTAFRFCLREKEITSDNVLERKGR